MAEPRVAMNASTSITARAATTNQYVHTGSGASNQPKKPIACCR